MGDLSAQVGWGKKDLIAKMEDKRRQRAVNWHKKRIEKANKVRKALNLKEINKVKAELAQYGYWSIFKHSFFNIYYNYIFVNGLQTSRPAVYCWEGSISRKLCCIRLIRPRGIGQSWVSRNSPESCQHRCFCQLSQSCRQSSHWKKCEWFLWVMCFDPSLIKHRTCCWEAKGKAGRKTARKAERAWSRGRGNGHGRAVRLIRLNYLNMNKYDRSDWFLSFET